MLSNGLVHKQLTLLGLWHQELEHFLKPCNHSGVLQKTDIFATCGSDVKSKSGTSAHEPCGDLQGPVRGQESFSL